MKRLLVAPIICLIVLFTVLPFMAACTTQAPAPAPAPAPSAPVPSPAAAPAKPVVLKFHHTDPLRSMYARRLQPFAQYAYDVEQVTRGRVQVDIYPSSTLTTQTESFDAVIGGVADMAFGFTGVYPGRFPLSDLVTLPKLGISDGVMGTELLWRLWDKYPELKAEYKDVKVLILYAGGLYPLGSNKALHLPKDLQGLKVRSMGGPPALYMKAVGASPLTVAPGDIYTGMEKKTFDAWMMEWAGIEAYKLNEVTPYITDAGMFPLCFWLVMNKAKWNSLPPDVQQQMESISGLHGSLFTFALNIERGGDVAIVQILRGGGKTQIIFLTPQEEEEWRKAGAPVQKDYVAGLQAKGLPAQAMYDDMLRFIKEYKPLLKNWEK